VVTVADGTPGVVPSDRRRERVLSFGLFFNLVKVSTAAAADREPGRGRQVPELILASTSPRRRRLLTAAGLGHRATAPAFDDDSAAPGIGGTASVRTRALAWMKAIATARRRRSEGPGGGLVLAADTLLAADGRSVGKPATKGDAERLLRSLANRGHEVWTGHALIDLATGRRLIWADVAEVRFGRLDETLLRRHLDREAWRGRAGGYSLDELQHAGWAVECHGDPETVLGLCTARVRRAIALLEVGPDSLR